MINIKEKMLFLVRLPPPMHGASKMNQLYLNSKLLNKNYNIKSIKLNNYSSLKQMGTAVLAILGSFKVSFQLLYNLIFWNPKIIYFEMAPCGNAFIRDSLYVWISKLFGKKIICQFHGRGMNESVNHKIMQNYYKSVLKNVKCILLSECLYSSVDKVVPKENAVYLPNGIPDEITDTEFRKIIKEKSNNHKLNLLYFSNMIPSKGVMDVLEICKLLNKDHIDFVCYFAGAWDSDDFKKSWFDTVKKYNLQEKCIYLGPKYGDEKKSLFAKTDYLIFPTKYPRECYPLVILEAYMVGVPVLSYNTGAIKEMINSSELGFVSEKNDYKDIYRYIKNNGLSIKNSSKIRSKFKDKFVFEIAEKKMLEIINATNNSKNGNI